MKTTVKHPALETQITDQPAIYVGTYKKYNEGSINGAWIDMTLIEDREDFENLCKAIHADEEDPEFMFQDFQGIPKDLISESYLDDKFFEINEVVESSHLDREIIEAGLTAGIDLNDIEETYSGQFSSDEDFAEDMAEQLGELPKDLTWPLYCIDWTHAARELMMDYCEVNGYYFRNL